MFCYCLWHQNNNFHTFFILKGLSFTQYISVVETCSIKERKNVKSLLDQIKKVTKNKIRSFDSHLNCPLCLYSLNNGNELHRFSFFVAKTCSLLVLFNFFFFCRYSYYSLVFAISSPVSLTLLLCLTFSYCLCLCLHFFICLSLSSATFLH